MMKFLAELSRRNVFRVAAAYVIVGWIVLQVVGLLAPGLGLPIWTLALIFVVLLSAFPIALFLAWAFEMTPDGVKKSEASAVAEAVGPSRTDLGLIAVGVLLIATTILVPPRALAPPTEVTPAAVAAEEQIPIFSFAALPLDNLSDDLRLNFIADGIAEDVLTRMAGSHWFKVAASKLPIGRSGVPEDIAYGAVYLASDEASYVTTQDLVIDGGLVAGDPEVLPELLGKMFG